MLLLSYWDFVSQDTLGPVRPHGFPCWEIEHGGVLERTPATGRLPSAAGSSVSKGLLLNGRVVDDPARDLATELVSELVGLPAYGNPEPAGAAVRHAGGIPPLAETP